MLVSLIGEVFSDGSATNDALEVISLLSCAVLATLKVLVLRGFRSKMLDIVTGAVEDWNGPAKSPKARKVMMDHAKIGRRVCVFQMTSAYVTTATMIVGQLPILASPIILNGSDPQIRGLPLRTVSIFGDMSDLSYALVYVLQAFQLLATCTGNIGNDVYFFGFTLHMCGQFRVLGDDLKSFDVDVDELVRREKFVGLVERHIRLGRLAKNLEDSFNIIILVQLTANSMQMCLMGIETITG